MIVKHGYGKCCNTNFARNNYNNDLAREIVPTTLELNRYNTNEI